MKKVLTVLLCIVLLTMLFSISASAYIDPSALTYIIQVAAGIIIAGGAALTIYWKKIKIFLKKRKEKKRNSK